MSTDEGDSKLKEKSIDATNSLEECLGRAQEYLEQENLEAAIQELRGAAQKFEGNTRIWMILGGIYEDIGEASKADECYSRAVEIDLTLAEAWERLCIIRLKQRRETDAEQAGKHLLELRGKKGQSWAILRSDLREKHVKGSLPSRYQTRDSSLKSVGTKLSELVVHSDIHSEQLQSEGIDSVKKSLPIFSRGESQEDAHKLGKEILEDRVVDDNAETVIETHASVTELLSGTTRKPPSRYGDSESWFDYAKVYAKNREYAKAIRSLEKGLEVDPNNTEALVLLGEMLVKDKRTQRGIKILSQVIENEPRNHKAFLILGKAYTSVEEFRAAARALFRYVKLMPNDSDAWGMLGHTLIKQERYTQASRAVLRALKVQPNNTEFLKDFAFTLERNRRFDQAISVLKKATSIDTEDADTYQKLGEILLKMGRAQEGAEALAKARSLTF